MLRGRPWYVSSAVHTYFYRSLDRLCEMPHHSIVCERHVEGLQTPRGSMGASSKSAVLLFVFPIIASLGPRLLAAHLSCPDMAQKSEPDGVGHSLLLFENNNRLKFLID